MKQFVFSLLASGKNTDISLPEDFLDAQGLPFLRQYSDLLIFLKDSRVSYIYEDNEIIFQYGKISGKINVLLTENNKLRRIEVIPDFDNNKISAQKFDEFLSSVSDKHSLLLISEKDRISVNSSKKLAVASLIKLVVASIVFSQIRKNVLNIDSHVYIEEEYLSCLSTGLSHKDTGKEITVKELLNLMLIASDNSAMDIPIRILGNKCLSDYLHDTTKMRENISDFALPLSKDLYKNAWCSSEDGIKSRKRSLTEVEWTNGTDYFMSLDDIYGFASDLRFFEWLPWDGLNDGRRKIYKAGNAPGVCSFMCLNRKAEDKEFCLSYVINSTEHVPAVAQIYANMYAQKLIEKYQF